MRLDRLTMSDLPVSVGDYRLLVALGERGEGRVFRAEDAAGRPVEITALWPSLLAGAGVRDEVADELAGVRGFAHPHVVGVLDVGEHHGGLWIANEPVVGVTLRELVSGELRASSGQVLSILVDVLDALVAIHGREHEGGALLHRCLTPERVLVTQSGAVRVRGLGLGGLPDGVGLSASAASGSWASPEQIGRRALGPSSDLFSVGALIAFGLLGKPPFRTDSDAIPSERVGEIVRVLARGEVFSRLERRAMGLGSALQGFLAVDPASRFVTAAQARDVLRTVLGRMPDEEPVGALIARVLVDQAATVAAPEGALPTSRDLLPLESLAPEVELEEDTEDTDADFLLPSQRMEAMRLRADGADSADREAKTQPLPPVGPPPPPDLGSRKTTAVAREAFPPRNPPPPSVPKAALAPLPPMRPAPPVVPAGVTVPPRAPVAAPPRPAPVAAPPRPAPVAAPPSSWAPPVAPPSPGLRASGEPPLVRRGPSAPVPAARTRAEPPPTSEAPVEPAAPA